MTRSSSKAPLPSWLTEDHQKPELPSLSMLDFIQKHFHPLLDFLSTNSRALEPSESYIPWTIRWRLLAFQPLVILTDFLVYLPYVFRRRPYVPIRIPTRSGTVRALVFEPPALSTNGHFNSRPFTDTTGSLGLRPVHIDVHGGAFCGGSPEADARFCSHVAETTGAVVISASYRFAPRWRYPAAIDDIDDIVDWVRNHAESAFRADPRMMTIGGSSAGGNLAMASTMGKSRDGEELKAVVAFYAPVSNPVLGSNQLAIED